MGTLVKYLGSYYYVNRNPDRYDHIKLYTDFDCTQLAHTVYGKDWYEYEKGTESPVITNRDKAVMNIVRVHGYSNEIKYILWEIEKQSKQGKFEFLISLLSPPSEEALKVISILGYRYRYDSMTQILKVIV